MEDIKWHEAEENNDGIKTIAMIELDKKSKGVTMYGYNRIVGYNGIIKGEKVLYKGEEYTVVMVSRLGTLVYLKQENCHTFYVLAQKML